MLATATSQRRVLRVVEIIARESKVDRTKQKQRSLTGRVQKINVTQVSADVKRHKRRPILGCSDEQSCRQCADAVGVGGVLNRKADHRVHVADRHWHAANVLATQKTKRRKKWWIDTRKIGSIW